MTTDPDITPENSSQSNISSESELYSLQQLDISLPDSSPRTKQAKLELCHVLKDHPEEADRLVEMLEDQFQAVRLTAAMTLAIMTARPDIGSTTEQILVDKLGQCGFEHNEQLAEVALLALRTTTSQGAKELIDKIVAGNPEPRIIQTLANIITKGSNVEAA